MRSSEILIAFTLDLVLGDPPRLPHPVRWMGKFITYSENWLRRWAVTPRTEKVAGLALAIGVIGLVYGVSASVIGIAEDIHQVLGSVVTIYLAYTTLAIRSLRDAAMEVVEPLTTGHLSVARENLSGLVGRQTANLGEADVIRASVESVAENTSDGVIAPLFFMALGGVPVAMAYKAINTLDSMVGYQSPRYLNFGWASARIDDAANFFPARLTGLFISLLAGIFYRSFGRALKTLLRDGRKHESPNSGIPEAAMAGALGIQLGGPVVHPDKPGGRDFMGKDVETPRPRHIRKAIRLMYGASVLMLCLVLLSGLWMKS